MPERELSAEEARRAARRAVSRIRRDAHFVAVAEPLGWSAFARFRGAPPTPPEGARLVRHRLDWTESATPTP